MRLKAKALSREVRQANVAKSDSNSNNKILILRLTLFEECVCEEFVFEELVQVAAAAARHVVLMHGQRQLQAFMSIVC